MANFIWDLDGTLINSYPHTLEALAETYQALDLSFDREAVATYIIDYSIRDLIANLVASGQVLIAMFFNSKFIIQSSKLWLLLMLMIYIINSKLWLLLMLEMEGNDW